jgi:linoleoyl-CoA desaturase
MHDGSHVAFSSNKFLTYLGSYSADLSGSSGTAFRKSHNYGHHGSVNHYELDGAIDFSYPMLRVHYMQPRLPFHRFQHIYVWVLYTLVVFAEFAGGFDELFWMSNFPTRRGSCGKVVVAMQICVKVLFWVITLFIPSYHYSWFEVFPMWFIFISVFSYSVTPPLVVNHWTTIAGRIDNSKVDANDWGKI